MAGHPLRLLLHWGTEGKVDTLKDFSYEHSASDRALLLLGAASARPARSVATWAFARTPRAWRPAWTRRASNPQTLCV